MRAGKLTHRLVYEEPTETTGATGQVLQTWAAVGNLWGEVRTLNGRESLLAQTMQSTVSHVVITRPQTYPLKPTGRVRDLDALAGATGLYQLVAVTDEAGDRRGLKLYATEVTAPAAADSSNL